MRKKGKPNPDQRYCCNCLACVCEVETKKVCFRMELMLMKNLSIAESVILFQILWHLVSA